VIDTKGDIMTAEHVVDSANSITVHWQDGSSTKATLVGSDKSTDTAVIHVGRIRVQAPSAHARELRDVAARRQPSSASAARSAWPRR
jgi:S1-C subfamily serine protease